MSKKHKPDERGYVYSTNPDFKPLLREGNEETLPPSKQPLRIRLETKHRAGKAATVVTGFVGLDADLQALGKQLKTHCGTGGSAKDGEIIIQGDQREKVRTWLLKQGYAAK